MISPKYIAAAAAKTANADEQEALARIEAMAAEIAVLEGEFPQWLESRKAGRNESKVKLSKEQRLFVAAIPGDLAAGEAETLRLLRELPTAVEVIESVSFTMPGVPLDWSFLLPGLHADDRPAVEDIIRRQRALRAALAEYLERFRPVSS
jgi:hypothetical protein